MANPRTIRPPSFRPDFSLILISLVFALLWIAGGASRADTLGQVVVRAGSWAILIVAVLFGPRPALRNVRFVFLLLTVMIALPVIQLVPLPPAWWQALPGRQILLIPGDAVPWRPWSMTPGATRNALASLIVPVTVLLVQAQAKEQTHRRMSAVLLVVIATAMLLGLLQFSGVNFNNPLINDTSGVVSSIFANRNHFALFLAIGCLVAPVWAFLDHQALRWRGPLASGLVLLFVLTILATGSRSGMLLGALALALALLLIGRRLRRRLAMAPSWVFPAVVVTALLAVGGFVAISFAADRASAIDRLIALDNGEDMRSRALPTVLSMIRTYMPFGSGFGGFDPMFRLHEPLGLLKFTYFNQAHNDFLGVALDGGLPGVAVLAAGVAWWLIATVWVWRATPNGDVLLGRLGSATILLVLTASVTDYPARTPTIMAVLVVAAWWLARATADKMPPALPD
ncbi:O-antigen ligase family protein [Sphingomonas sp. 179-A 2A2 NHS]|uniref:O-antigen ligase family protein n=1 Tax=Sphingomonas sp. 179-A 2A2 NHS TaxID=3374290 RepID=UPI00387A338D